MKERPILFKAEMVRAILSGQKTQTRRIVKLPSGYQWLDIDVGTMVNAGGHKKHISDLKCKQGDVGDRLWVRETFALETQVESDQKPPHNDGRPIKYQGEFGDQWVQPHYRATDPVPHLAYEDMPEDVDHMCRWKPSILMPRWASRINLEIVSVRIERLHDIGRDGRAASDVLAEGITREQIAHQQKFFHPDDAPALAYATLWNAINGAGSWDLNPWVWVVEFNRVDVAA